MRRRTFVKSSVAVGISALLPGCQRVPSGNGSTGSAAIAAVTGDGREVSIEAAAAQELARELQGVPRRATIRRARSGMP